MNVIVVDDEQSALENLEYKLLKLKEIKTITLFDDPENAFEFLRQEKVDVVFLDIEMYQMNGITLAKKIRTISPHTNIIFVTGFIEYMKDAFPLRVSGYLTKPVSVEQLKEELENLRNPVEITINKVLRVQCFGNFEVFHNQYPIIFKYNKTKELFAFLIDRRGAAISNGELIGVLWEDKPVTASLKSQLRNLIIDLVKTLTSFNAESVLVKLRNNLAVDITKIDCDYFRFINGEVSAVNQYCGEYMSQYSWAEMTLGSLEKTK